MADFLIGRAARNLMLGNRFHWYLMVEVSLEDRIMAKMYGRVVFKFMGKVLEASQFPLMSLTLSEADNVLCTE